MKVRVWIETKKIGSTCEDIFELEADDDLEDICRDVAFEYIEWGYDIIEE